MKIKSILLTLAMLLIVSCTSRTPAPTGAATAVPSLTPSPTHPPTATATATSTPAYPPETRLKEQCLEILPKLPSDFVSSGIVILGRWVGENRRNYETILLDTQGGHYFGLDPVGTRMWQLLRQHGALRPAYEILLTEYNVTPERLEADLLALTSKMIEKGLANIRTAAE